jgi:hypothetical protein
LLVFMGLKEEEEEETLPLAGSRRRLREVM